MRCDMSHPETPEDDELVAGWLAGDPEMLHLLVRRHGPWLFRLAWRLMGSREDAEDLVQETFGRMLSGIGRYRPQGQFAAWLRTILVRIALDSRRRPGPSPAAVEAEDRAPGPEATVIARETAERLRQELGRLPPGYRAVVVLRNGEGLSVEEVARALGLTKSVVKNRALRARRMLREAIERAEEGEGNGRTACAVGPGVPAGRSGERHLG